MHYGLIGYPLGHSFSQQYFTEKFLREGLTGARYDLFPLVDLAGLPALLQQHPTLQGLNVTIPHKEAVIPYLDGLDDTARLVGAVNCLRRQGNRWRGFNTDVFGFERALRGVANGRWTAPGTPALVLGTGGAAKAVAFVLKKLGLPFRFVSRRPQGENELSYPDVHRLPADAYRLIVNTTPLGMTPAAETCPDLPFERLGAEHLVFDLVYNPPETLLLRRAFARGCAVRNGLEMLHLQAEKAWEIWQQD